MRGEGDQGRALKIPIAHGEGRFFADDSILDALEDNRQVIYRYCDENGQVHTGANPNGAARNIAGICNGNRNVFGMMPHPERACSAELGNTDGRLILQALFLQREQKPSASLHPELANI